jgi:hypothetical protein
MRLVLMSIKYRTPGSEFYGLVTQKGPGPMNLMDPFRYERSDASAASTLHAGHGDYKEIIDPGKTMDTRKPPPTMSSYVQREVVYKPLVYNATTTVPGRAEVLERNSRGLTVGKAPMNENTTTKPEPITPEVEPLPPTPIPPFKTPRGGEAPADAPRYNEGPGVGDILGTAGLVVGSAGLAATLIPVVGPAIGAAAGVVSLGLEAGSAIANLFENNYAHNPNPNPPPNYAAQAAILNYGNSAMNGASGREYDSSRRPSASSSLGSGSSFYTADNSTSYDGSNFSNTFGGYKPGKTLASSERFGSSVGSRRGSTTSNFSGLPWERSSQSSHSTKSLINGWLEELTYAPQSPVGSHSSIEEIKSSLGSAASLEEFIPELNMIIQAEEDAVMRKRLAALLDQVTTQGTQTDFGPLSGAAEYFNPVVQGARRMSAGAQTNKGTEAQVIEALEAQIDLLVDNEGRAASNWKSIAEQSTKWLNLLGLDTEAVAAEMGRKNPDIQTIEELIQEGVDFVRQRDIIPIKEVRDFGTDTLDLVQQAGGVRNGTFIPPVQDLITQAKRQVKRKGSTLESVPTKRRAGPVTNDRETQFGGSYAGVKGQISEGGLGNYKASSKTYPDGGTSTQTSSKPLKTPTTRSKMKSKKK